MKIKDTTDVPTLSLKNAKDTRLAGRLSRKKPAKLTLSTWYGDAAQSIGISNKKPAERRRAE